MSDIDLRLHRAARELRELDIAPPPLQLSGRPGGPASVIRRVPTMALPVLVLLGGLAVMVGALSRDVDTTPVAESVLTAETASDPATALAAAVPPPVTVRVPTAHEELVMIGSLSGRQLGAATPTAGIGAPAQVVTVTSLRRF